MPRISHRPPKHPRALLDFLQDFGAQKHENIAIPAGAEVGTAHDLDQVPGIVWIYRNSGGHVQHGDTADDADTFYLVNIGMEAATVSVLIFP